MLFVGELKSYCVVCVCFWSNQEWRIKRNWQHWVHRTGRRQTKQKHNTETLTTLGTQDTGRRQTKQKHNTETLATLGTQDRTKTNKNKNITQRY